MSFSTCNKRWSIVRSSGLLFTAGVLICLISVLLRSTCTYIACFLGDLLGDLLAFWLLTFQTKVNIVALLATNTFIMVGCGAFLSLWSTHHSVIVIGFSHSLNNTLELFL